MRYTNRLPVIAIPVIIFAIVIGIYILASPSGSSTMAKSGSSVEAPDFTFALLDGKKVSLSDYRGKPVVLNFWASWCPPCREETPVMVKISDKYEEQVQFLGVVQSDTAESASKFAEEFKMNYPSGLDSTGEISNAYKIAGIPTSFFINGDGTVQASYIGPIEEEILIDYIEDLLGS